MRTAIRRSRSSSTGSPPSRPPPSTTRAGSCSTCTRASTRPSRSSGRTSAATSTVDGLMPELRIDPLSGLRPIVAGERADRPGGGFHVEPQPELDPETDPFLEGHEDRTPPEVFALRPGGGPENTPGWRVRVVPNLYPALGSQDGRLGPDEDPLALGRGEPDLFAARGAEGAHEVIVNTPAPANSLSQVDAEQLE